MPRTLKDDGCTKRFPNSNSLICLEIVSAFFVQNKSGKLHGVRAAAKTDCNIPSVFFKLLAYRFKKVDCCVVKTDSYY